MVKKNRKLTDEEAMQILIAGEYGIMSTVGSDNIPYGVPLSYVVVDNHIYFHCAKIGHKLDNISYNNDVCFTVVGKTEPVFEAETVNFSTYYESAIVFGKAVETTDKVEIMNVMEVLCEKYLNDHMEHFKQAMEKRILGMRVIKISIDQITGKAKKAM